MFLLYSFVGRAVPYISEVSGNAPPPLAPHFLDDMQPPGPISSRPGNNSTYLSFEYVVDIDYRVSCGLCR